MLWKTGRSLQLILAGQRGGIDSTCGDQMGPASDRRLPAESRQTSGIVCKQWTVPLRKRNRDSTCCEKTRQRLFSLHRTSKRDDAQKRLSALRCKLVSEKAIRREQMGKFWETSGHLGDYSEQHLHARHRLMSLSWQLRRWTRRSAPARRTSLESDLHRALRNGRSHWAHRLTQLLGGSCIGVRKRLFFHLPGSRPDKEEMKTHVTMPGVMGGMDAQVVLEPLDVNTVTRAKTILFCTAKELAKGNRPRAAPQWSAPAERFLICASPSYLSVGPRRLEVIGVEEITKTARKYTCAKQELVSVLVHSQRALHTPCSAHNLNGTRIDKRNGRKGMLGTRIIHVTCPWWKSLFAAMVREMNTSLQTGTASFADEGEREQCSNNDAWDGI